MNNTQLSFKTKPLMLVALMAFLMLLTRGSHVLTHVSLPDASLALLLIGGLYLRKAIWFGFFIVLATLIDFGAAAVDSIQAFCLTPGYWGMLPTYALMWLGGVWLSTQTNLNFFKFSLVSLLATFLAFVISTQTYYLFSGRFPAEGLISALQHGWEYLPSYAGFSLMYLAIFWVSAKLLAKLGLTLPTAQITQ
jgi:hypothetical protein